MPEHTPGPWTFIRPPYNTHGKVWSTVTDEPVAELHTAYIVGGSSTARANAALIAAAPDLLAALEDIVGLTLGCASLEDKHKADAIFASAREAIAKAIGCPYL